MTAQSEQVRSEQVRSEQVRSEQRPDFDPVDPAFLENPYPIYERLRAAGPIVRLGPTQWVAARYGPVARLLRDTRLRNEWPEPFQAMRLGDGPVKDFLLRLMLYREGSDHAGLRRFLSGILHAMPQAELRDYVAAQSAGQLRAALAAGHLEVMTDLAFPLPLAVACQLIGVPEEDRLMISQWGLEVIKSFTVTLAEEDRPAVNAAIESLRHYFADWLRAADGQRGSAGAVALADAVRRGDYSREELVDNVIFLLVSGFTTTVHMIATVCAILLEHPEAVAQLRADRSLLGGAVEECLRYDAPLQHVSRLVAEPIEVEGERVRPGRVVHLLLGSANHDSDQFPDPGRLDLRRSPNPHVSFGSGLHACLGASIGRLEVTTLLDCLLDACAVIEPDGPAVRRPMQVFRTYERIPVRVTAS